MKAARKQSYSQPMRQLVWSGALLLILCAAAQIAFAQQAAPAAASGKTAAAPSPTPLPGAQTGTGERATPKTKGDSEGIRIHGHWVLEVKNPDGKLVERREFSNALVTDGYVVSGNQILVALISGMAAAGAPAVVLVQGGVAANVSDTCYGTTCFEITTSNSPMANWDTFDGPNKSSAVLLAMFSSLQTGLVSSVNFSPNVNWVLSGNYTFSVAASISDVQVYLPICIVPVTGAGGVVSSFYSTYVGNHGLAGVYLHGTYPGSGIGTITPNACGGTNLDVIFGPLTSTTIPGGPLALAAGQVVTVTVTISFS
jgi:hypothetical protein